MTLHCTNHKKYTKGCLDCRRIGAEYSKDYYDGNPDRRKQVAENSKNWKANHPAETKIQKRKYYLANQSTYLANQRLNKYGVTPEEFVALLVKQDYKCALCRTPFTKGKRQNLEHNHETGIIRGITCTGYNLLIGLLEKKNISLAVLKTYLSK